MDSQVRPTEGLGSRSLALVNRNSVISYGYVASLSNDRTTGNVAIGLLEGRTIAECGDDVKATVGIVAAKPVVCGCARPQVMHCDCLTPNGNVQGANRLRRIVSEG